MGLASTAGSSPIERDAESLVCKLKMRIPAAGTKRTPQTIPRATEFPGRLAPTAPPKRKKHAIAGTTTGFDFELGK